MTTTHPGTTRSGSSPRYGTRSRTRDRTTQELFARCGGPISEHEREELIARVIEMHLDVAHSIASRYRSRGVALDDLRQVAALALTTATRRYDVTLGHEFLSYAVPSIRGEIRRHFRDHGWMVRPPRRIQELQARVHVAESELLQQLGRSPLPSEVASHLDEHGDAVLEALSSDGCYVVESLDRPLSRGHAATLGDTVAVEDPDLLAAEARTLLRPVLRGLPPHDREILLLRFVEQLTQREIAERLGRTQSAVSRSLRRILAELRSAADGVSSCR